jgi:phosphatidylglycerophosphate synthase
MGIKLVNSIRQKTIASIPNSFTLLRLFALPHLIWSFNHQITFAVYGLFLLAIGSDLADGYISRRLGANSKFGANLDTGVDFIFINGMYLIFIFKGLYSVWLIVLIIFMFLQFLLTNHHLKKTIYDPIGKYYGSLLFGGIGLTLLYPTQLMYNIVTIGIIISTIAAIFSRLLYFHKTKNYK